MMTKAINRNIEIMAKQMASSAGSSLMVLKTDKQEKVQARRMLLERNVKSRQNNAIVSKLEQHVQEMKKEIAKLG